MVPKRIPFACAYLANGNKTFCSNTKESITLIMNPKYTIISKEDFKDRLMFQPSYNFWYLLHLVKYNGK